MHSKRKRRTILVALLAFVLATAAYAFTASNTFPGGAGAAGDGTGTISGFTITNVSYQLDGTDPTLLASVTFNVAPTPTTVKIRTNNMTAGTWVTCTAGASSSCTFPGGTGVQAATSLQVVAAS